MHEEHGLTCRHAREHPCRSIRGYEEEPGPKAGTPGRNNAAHKPSPARAPHPSTSGRTRPSWPSCGTARCPSRLRDPGPDQRTRLHRHRRRIESTDRGLLVSVYRQKIRKHSEKAIPRAYAPEMIDAVMAWINALGCRKAAPPGPLFPRINRRALATRPSRLAACRQPGRPHQHRRRPQNHQESFLAAPGSNGELAGHSTAPRVRHRGTVRGPRRDHDHPRWGLEGLASVNGTWTKPTSGSTTHSRSWVLRGTQIPGMIGACLPPSCSPLCVLRTSTTRI